MTSKADSQHRRDLRRSEASLTICHHGPSTHGGGCAVAVWRNCNRTSEWLLEEQLMVTDEGDEQALFFRAIVRQSNTHEP